MSDRDTEMKAEFKRMYTLFSLQYQGIWDVKEERASRVRFWLDELCGSDIDPSVIYPAAEAIRKLEGFDRFPPNSQEFIRHARSWVIENGGASEGSPEAIGLWLSERLSGSRTSRSEIDDLAEYAAEVISSCQFTPHEIDVARKCLERDGWPIRSSKVKAVLGRAAIERIPGLASKPDEAYSIACSVHRVGQTVHPCIVRAANETGLYLLKEGSYLSRRAFEESFYRACQDYLINPPGGEDNIREADEKGEPGSYETTRLVIANILESL